MNVDNDNFKFGLKFKRSICVIRLEISCGWQVVYSLGFGLFFTTELNAIESTSCGKSLKGGV